MSRNGSKQKEEMKMKMKKLMALVLALVLALAACGQTSTPAESGNTAAPPKASRP